ncbi:deoxyfructose oxidoreductase [Deinococcus malanensis]|uniref:Deoxyfructose oxidoreductase n=1 Tax=Deinococcus malanensis TaxID=1706855 RepID=A0ABQ2EZG7_9DEIO|nr:Gfo/Idh/MocA family oxidoreductase [Deinococcus malanensis]GGK35710.1 deoxyfructose oxidoreductase [Deinococcus malanensis]
MNIRWGFLGASRIGNALAPAMRAAGQTLAGIAARDPGRADAYARKHGFIRTHLTYDDLIRDPQIDAIYNALPNDLHFPWSARALEAGKHVLCEKPMMLGAGEVRQLMSIQKRSGSIISEAFMHRHHPQYAQALALIRAGELGELRTASAGYRFTLTRPDDYRWEAEKGGGALYDVGCYCVSALRLLLDREPVRVSAARHDLRGIDGTLVGWLDFGEGFAAHFDCSLEASPGQYLSLVGSRATLNMDVPFGPHRREAHLQAGDRTFRYEPNDPYEFMVADFGRAVRHREEPTWGLDDALAQAQVLDALFESARRGEVVTVSSRGAGTGG